MTRWIAHLWPLGLAVWLLAALAVWHAASPWTEQAAREALSTLPEDSPITQAERVFQRAFPGPEMQSQLVVVLRRAEGLTAQDKLFVSLTLVPGIQALGASPQTPSPSDMPTIVRIRSWSDEYVGQVLLSHDQQATLVLVDVAGDLLDEPVRRFAQAADALLTRLHTEGKTPAGLQVELTGTALVGRDLVAAQQQSLQRLRVALPAIVVLLLLLVYRRPATVFVLLAVVFVAVLMTLNLLVLLTEAGYVHIYSGLEAYIILLLFVTGMTAGGLWRGHPHGTRRTVALGGLAALIGCGALSAASFGRYHWAGVGMAVGQTILLLALLTLLPWLVRLLGRTALWPRRVPDRLPQFLRGRIHRFWAASARRVSGSPGAIVLVAAVLLPPLAVLGLRHQDTVNTALLRELPANAPSLRGIALLEEHFPPGLVAPVILLIVDDRLDFSSDAGVAQVKLLSQRLLEQRDGVPLADVRSVAQPLGTATVVREAIPGPAPVVALIERMIRAGAVAYYVGASEHTPHGVARLDLLLSRDPLTPEMLARMGQLRQSITAALPPQLQGAQLYLLGDGPRLDALKHVVVTDQQRLEIAATVAMFLVLSVGLRRIGRAALVVLAVLLSYWVAMGTTWLVFRAASGPSFPGISWQIPVLVFLILLAHGGLTCLSLFAELGPTNAPRRLCRAVRRRGGAIAGSGLVLAGTLAALAFGAQLTGIGQMAFAGSLAVLVESWLVVPLLLPAILGLSRSRAAWIRGREAVREFAGRVGP